MLVVITFSSAKIPVIPKVFQGSTTGLPQIRKSRDKGPKHGRKQYCNNGGKVTRQMIPPNRGQGGYHG